MLWAPDVENGAMLPEAFAAYGKYVRMSVSMMVTSPGRNLRGMRGSGPGYGSFGGAGLSLRPGRTHG